ncbi:MAG: hypothetical protein WCD44_03770 [Candidatus Babeliales bacterium]
MGISYSIDIVLDLKYEKHNIAYLFQKFIKNNIYLCADFFDEPEKIDSSGAADRILNMTLEGENRCVDAKFQDTEFSIWIYNKNNLINLSVGAFGIKWRKDFIDGHHGFDFARYIRLFLRMCDEFTILGLETSAL